MCFITFSLRWWLVLTKMMVEHVVQHKEQPQEVQLLCGLVPFTATPWSVDDLGSILLGLSWLVLVRVHGGRPHGSQCDLVNREPQALEIDLWLTNIKHLNSSTRQRLGFDCWRLEFEKPTMLVGSQTLQNLLLASKLSAINFALSRCFWSAFFLRFLGGFG